MKIRNETDTGYTKEGLELSAKFVAAIEPVIEEAIKSGATVAELHYLLTSDVEETILTKHRHHLREVG